MAAACMLLSPGQQSRKTCNRSGARDLQESPRQRIPISALSRYQLAMLVCFGKRVSGVGAASGFERLSGEISDVLTQ